MTLVRTRRGIRGGIIAVLILSVTAVAVWRFLAPPAPWSDEERAIIASLWIRNLPPLPTDPTNAVGDIREAAELGHRLFFDPRLSGNGGIACSTCHQPIRRFTDGLPLGVAIGMSKRNTPSIVGTAYSPWLYWDGRKDSHWSQALSPIEDPNEHGSDRLHVLGVIASDTDYRAAYESLFGAPPDLSQPAEIGRAFSNVGKAIAAYERLLMPGDSRFDAYVEHLESGGDFRAQDILSDAEINGLRLFIGEAQCTRCHNGPLFTNSEFHNTGLLSPAGEVPDRGRSDGVKTLMTDPFNCMGPFSDDPSHECSELRYARTGPELLGATRTPSLRNIADTAPFQSKGHFQTLREVLRHYNEAPNAMIGHSEIEPLRLSERQLAELEDFLNALDAPLATDPRWLAPPE